jgi:hypothetical protein
MPVFHKEDWKVRKTRKNEGMNGRAVCEEEEKRETEGRKRRFNSEV